MIKNEAMDIFVISLIIDPLLGLATFPSVLLTYWIWKDGEQIEYLLEEIKDLREDIAKIK